MSESKQEEIIGALWAIAAVCAFGAGFDAWGYIFGLKAALDTALSIGYGIREIRASQKESK